MTTQVSQQPPTTQASSSTSASQPILSYASTAKKAVSSPSIATGSSTPSPAVAVGGSAAVQQHGKTNSISPVNGRSSVPPAVPAVAAPAIVHSSAVANGGSDHSRKSSVTMSANGPSGYIPNGGPVGGSKEKIQFGNFTDSPAVSHSTPQISQPTSSAPIAIPSNPRVTSPAQSPSPIPTPSVSGGRPSSGLAPSNGAPINFGSLGGDGDVSLTPNIF
jgi:translation initiation factor 4G